MALKSMKLPTMQNKTAKVLKETRRKERKMSSSVQEVQ